MPDSRTAELIAFFTAAFGVKPTHAVRAPGRVNLIGEHTDYNDGYCLPMAIERDVRVAYCARGDAQMRVVSMQQKGAVAFKIGATIEKSSASEEQWANYVKGCARVLAEEHHSLTGIDCAINGDVPLGSGLSSSAALEVAIMLALIHANGLTYTSEQIARLAQRAENEYVGAKCGILDQLSSTGCLAGQAMLMDCRTLSLTPAPLPKGVSIVIADTGKRRGLVGSAYNERRQQCEAGAAALGVSHLRDVTLHGLWQAAEANKIDSITKLRCEHVIAENGRTQAAFACLKAGDAEAFGRLMDQSHADLRDKFQVSCRELDDLVAIARALPGCLGSRMTGAGFGGCTVSLVLDEMVATFVPALTARYKKLHDLPMAAYVTRAAPGAGILPLA
jgi:galactokinase